MNFNVEVVKNAIDKKKAALPFEKEIVIDSSIDAEQIKMVIAKKRATLKGQSRLIVAPFRGKSEKVAKEINKMEREVVEGEYYDAYAVSKVLNMSEKESIKLVRKTLVESNLEKN